MATENELRAALISKKAVRAAADARPDKFGFGLANGEVKRHQSALSREVCKGLTCPVCARAPHLFEDEKGVQIACPNRAEHNSVVTAADTTAAREAWGSGKFDPEPGKEAAAVKGRK